jgi:hypothetical protein
MLKRFVVLLLFGLIALCGAMGVLVEMFATEQLTPPQVTRQIGILTVSSIPPCDLDRVVHGPCLLPDSEARWLIQLEIQNLLGRRQEWALYGGGQGSLRVVHR